MRWVVMQGDPEFFRVTKRLHNRLHGAQDTAPLGPAERATYERCCARNADELTAQIRSAARPRSCCTIRRPPAWSRGCWSWTCP